jgi:hypothetical protein
MLDPARTLAVVAGASAWPAIPAFTPARAFANTAAAASDYLTANTGIGLPTSHVLDLFEEPDVIVQYARMETFLRSELERMGATHGEGATLLFWYIGHGAFLGSRREYCLLVRGTSELFGAETSMRVTALSHALHLLAPRSARIIILDCCFAGEAAKHFQGTLDQAVAAQVGEALSADRGVVVLAASGARATALLADETTKTRFGAALLDVLETGDPQRGQALSVRDLAELSWQRLTNGALDTPPRPEVHSPDQAYGDLSTVPLFPNPAASPEAMTEPLAPMQHRSTTDESLPTVPGRPEVRASLLDTVLEGRPVEALSAARRLAEATGVVDDALVNRLPDNEWRRRALRLAIQGDPARAADVLVPAIIGADQDWARAAKATALLSPALHSTIAQRLAKRLPDSPGIEASRMIIEGLGRTAACGYTAPVVREAQSSSYDWDKLGGCAAIALTRMVRFCELPYGQSTAFRDSTMHAQASFLVRHQDKPELRSVMFEVNREMRQLRAWHADNLMRDYLKSDTRFLVALGATALGHLRLVRACPHLADRYSHGGDLDIATRGTLLLEIARIGGADAVSFLGARGDDPFARVALSRCLDSAGDNDFEDLVDKALHGEADEAWWVYRAIGRRPSERLLHFLEEGLTSDETSDRGVAALALAKATGPDARRRIEVARSEASTSLEQALTAMALLVTTGDTTIVQQVEELLAREAWLYEPILFEEVLSALEGWGGLPGQDLAATLRWIHSAV